MEMAEFYKKLSQLWVISVVGESTVVLGYAVVKSWCRVARMAAVDFAVQCQLNSCCKLLLL